MLERASLNGLAAGRRPSEWPLGQIPRGQPKEAAGRPRVRWVTLGHATQGVEVLCKAASSAQVAEGFGNRSCEIAPP